MLRMRIIGLTTCFLLLLTIAVSGGEQWLQLKYDCRHSGNVPDRTVTTPLGLVGAVALTDAVFTSPVVAGQRLYVLDGSGVLFAIDRETLQVIWKFASRGGPSNCNNVSSPAIAGDYIHFYAEQEHCALNAGSDSAEMFIIRFQQSTRRAELIDGLRARKPKPPVAATAQRGFLSAIAPQPSWRPYQSSSDMVIVYSLSSRGSNGSSA